MKNVRKLGILTGGGDCPGLNAVIRAVVHTAQRQFGLKVCSDLVWTAMAVKPAWAAEFPC